MKEFALIFRVAQNGAPQPSLTAAQMQERMNVWTNWMGGIAARNQLVNGGSRLGLKGSKTVSNKSVTDGPYAEVKEFINGYIIVKTNTVEEAVAIAKECPILFAEGGKVEVRPLVTPDNAE